MSEADHNSVTLRKFFLGPMSEEERAAFEDRLLEDEDLYRQALVMEDELADDLVEGRLEGAERAALVSLIERSPALRGRVDHAAALHAVLRQRAAATLRPSRWARAITALFSPTATWRPALAGGLAAAAVIGLWSHMHVRGLRSDIAALSQERDQARSEEGRAREALARERQDHARRLGGTPGEGASPGPGIDDAATLPPLAVFALTAASRSDDGPVVLRVPHGPGSVVLQAETESAPGDLRALLRTGRGEQVLVQGGLRPSTVGTLGIVDVRIPAELLSKGRYELVLEGRAPGAAWETLGIYAFEAVRSP